MNATHPTTCTIHPRQTADPAPDPHTAHAAHAVHAAQDETGPGQPWTVLTVALVAQILVVLDISVVNTALPSIAASLKLRGGELQWLVTAYLIGRSADFAPSPRRPAARRPDR